MLESIFRAILAGFVIYCFLWWASSNPRSVGEMKDKIDETAKEAVESLTD